MTAQTSPNGITTLPVGDSVQYSNLGAVAAAAVVITQATLSHYYALSIVAGTTTRSFPPMPVGSELSFLVAIPDAFSFLQIQEEDDTGVQRPLQGFSPSLGAVDFGCATPCVVVLNAAAGLTVVADTFSARSGTNGRIEANTAAIGYVLVTYKKIKENTTLTADGWIITNFQQQGFSVT